MKTKLKVKPCHVIAGILLSIAGILFLALLWAGIEQRTLLSFPAGEIIVAMGIGLFALFAVLGLTKSHDCDMKA